MARKPQPPKSRSAQTSMSPARKPVERPKGAKSPAPEAHTPRNLEGHQQPGTDKNYDNPADASHEDVAKALRSSESRAPQPFRKRDHLPDITSESVSVRMLADYWPADVERHEPGIRAKKGELVAFPSDEALELIKAGLAERVIDE